MAITEQTPKTARAWRGLMYALSRHAPMRLTYVVRSGRSLRALTSTKRRK